MHWRLFNYQMLLIFEKGFQHSAKEFLKKVPIGWDETKLFDRYPSRKLKSIKKVNL